MPKAEMSIDERKAITRKLIAELLVNPGRNKKEIKAGLEVEGVNVTTSEINSILYGHPRYFKQDNSRLPNWHVHDQYLEELLELLLEETPAFELDFYKGNEPRAWQLEAMGEWKRRGRRGVIEAVTGTGKTAVGILAAADAIARGRDVLVLVPGTDLLQQWYDACTKDLSEDVLVGRFGSGHKDTFETHHIIISTIQSARNNPLIPFCENGLLIADEVHGYGAKKSSLALSDVYDNRLGLTATYDRNDDRLEEILTPYFTPSGKEARPGDEVIVGCDYSRGLSDGILAPFRVATLGVHFDPEENALYSRVDNILRKAKTALICYHNCPEEPFGSFMQAVHTLSNGGHTDYYGAELARKFLKAFTERRRLLAGSQKKMGALIRLKQIIKMSGRTIVFTETKESAAKTAEIFRKIRIPSSNFDSSLSKDERRELLNQFQTGRVKLLAAPKVLDEGIDMPEADTGIILAASHSKRQMIQRMGRIIRPKQDGREAKFLILYVRNTNEDPEFGIHETFLQEMKENAVEMIDFPENVTEKEIIDWYCNK
jgi:superfamily II DNA or RNA helicase